jgi:hypothetical protein
MIFFVTAGKVTVTVNETVFIISRGGVWQVPRGTSVLAVSNPVSHFLPFSIPFPSCSTCPHDDLYSFAVRLFVLYHTPVGNSAATLADPPGLECR